MCESVSHKCNGVGGGAKSLNRNASGLDPTRYFMGVFEGTHFHGGVKVSRVQKGCYSILWTS